MQINRFKKLLRLTFDRSWEISIGLHGAAIAFFTIFSIAPLIIILLWVAGIFWGAQLSHAEFQQTLNMILDPRLAQSIQDIVESAYQSKAGLWPSILAIIALLFGATTLLSQVKQTLNLIWGVSNPNIHTLWQFLWDRFVGLLFIGILSVLFLAGMISESVLYAMSAILSPVLGPHNLVLIRYAMSFLNVLLTFAFFMAMFRVLPDLKVQLRDIAVGAAVTTLMVMIGKILIGWYLTSPALPATYRAAGSFVIFLIWIYYNVQVVLVGSIFTSVYARLYGGEVRPYWEASLDDWHLE